jgi:hypothetical protein
VASKKTMFGLVKGKTSRISGMTSTLRLRKLALVNTLAGGATQKKANRALWHEDENI